MSERLVLPPADGAPARIGKYRILRQIAQGGMAEIYLASASGIEGFEKLCVLKRILPLLATNNEFVEMFLDEARIAASLQHSNIAQVFDIGSDQGSYYFVMEFLRGQDVRHILQESVKRKEPVSFEHIVSIIGNVAAGLHYAHEMSGKDGKALSLVHRDISPQNVFVTHDGSVKLCDFGIAKSAARLTETRVGTLKGKIRYMSPEQCSSEPLDRRSDVFSLSIVLWELITLRRLFSGKCDFDVFKAIVEAPMPRPSSYRDLPEGLEQIVMKGLSRNRAARFQTAQELQLALEDWARAERVPASSVRLATFMTELFGAPEPMNESFLERTTENDPLAHRIRDLNAVDDADSDLLPAVEYVEDLDDATMTLKSRTIAREAEPTLAERLSMVPVYDPDDAAVQGRMSELETEEVSGVLVPRRRSWWPIAVAAGALLAIVAALVLRPTHAPDPIATRAAPAVDAITTRAAPAVDAITTRTAPAADAPPATAPAQPIPPVAVPSPVARATPAARPTAMKSTSTVHRSKRSVAARRQELDDMLPP